MWVRGSSLRNQWRLLGLERQGASEFLSQRMTHRARVGRFCGALGLACGRVNRSAKDTPEALGQLSSDEGEGVVQGVGYGVIGAGLAAAHYTLSKPSHYAGKSPISEIELNAFYRPNVNKTLAAFLGLPALCQSDTLGRREFGS